ncbi:hypothetical protein FOZ60_000853 [Perkinsus olseni]|uniref:Uncharacterized protein n=1 Tax=Perkinsus olseni TaxID=32597 RepID=A0A7J6PJR6_PEROL|nr:hypothetical protein FOZ60_000853 [Perkinsus olseni]
MQQERLLELDLQAEDEKQGILRSEISRAVVETIGEHPPDRPSAITGDDIVRDWVGQKAAREKVEKAARGTGIPELSSNSAANLPGKECAEEKEDKKARCDTPGLVKGGVMSMVCKHCQQPKAKGYNQHDYSDGSRYGICPMQPPKSTPDPAVVAYAREVAKSVTAYLPDGKKGTQHCGLCGLPLSATLRDTAGKQLASHERFLDEGEKLAWLCPLAGNIPPERVEQLRALKTQRSEAKAARRNEARRIRYIEAKRIRSEDVNEDLQIRGVVVSRLLRMQKAPSSNLGTSTAYIKKNMLLSSFSEEHKGPYLHRACAVEVSRLLRMQKAPSSNLGTSTAYIKKNMLLSSFSEEHKGPYLHRACAVEVSRLLRMQKAPSSNLGTCTAYIERNMLLSSFPEKDK